MASVQVGADAVVIALRRTEKIEALHGDLTIPRASITRAIHVPDGLAEISGIRAPGLGIPGHAMVGTFRDEGTRTFAACHGHRPAVLLELVDQPFDRVILTVEDPEAVLAQLA